LAAGLAQAGNKVVLVNSDFRRPTTDQFFNINNIIGLSDVLTGANSLKSALQRPGDEQLLVLSSGKMPPNPSELLGSQKMADLIESLKEWADWIIVDSPPLLAVADAAAIARWADGVLMVTRGGISTREAARKGREMLEKVGARIIGVAVWGLEEAGSGRGYGYYYDGYYGGYQGGYYYYGYYTPTEQGRSKKRGTPDSGAKGAAIDTGGPREIEMYIPEKSAGRRAAEVIGRVMAGLLAFLVVLAIVAIVAFFADQALGLGLVPTITKMLGIG